MIEKAEECWNIKIYPTLEMDDIIEEYFFFFFLDRCELREEKDGDVVCETIKLQIFSKVRLKLFKIHPLEMRWYFFSFSLFFSRDISLFHIGYSFHL